MATTEKGSGGEKGQAVISTLRKRKRGSTPAEVAEKVGCSIGRVYEVIRAEPELIERVERGKYRVVRD